MRSKFYSCRFLNPAWHWFGLGSGLVLIAGGLWLMVCNRLPIIVSLWVIYAMIFGLFFVAHCIRLLRSHKVRQN